MFENTMQLEQSLKSNRGAFKSIKRQMLTKEMTLERLRMLTTDKREKLVNDLQNASFFNDIRNLHEEQQKDYEIEAAYDNGNLGSIFDKSSHEYTVASE